MTTEQKIREAIKTGDYSGLDFKLPIRVELVDLEDWPEHMAIVTIEDETAVVRVRRNADVTALLPFNRQVQDDVISQLDA